MKKNFDSARFRSSSDFKNIENKVKNIFIRNGELGIFEFVFNVILTFIWTVLLWVTFGIRIGSNGPTDYFEHYTNWNWMINSIYFTIMLFLFLDISGTALYYWINIGFWITFASNWEVFWLVWLLVYDNGNIFLSLSTEGGGKYYLGAVNVANILLHLFPVWPITIHAILNRFTIFKFINDIFYNDTGSNLIKKIFFTIWSFGGILLVLGIYIGVVDPVIVYDLRYSIWWYIGLGFLVFIVFVVIPYIYVLLISKTKCAVQDSYTYIANDGFKIYSLRSKKV